MAELEQSESGCCAPAVKVACCEPTEKQDCCAPEGQTCGCSPGEAVPGVHEHAGVAINRATKQAWPS
jgi:hypothetical protein